jgi:hypothetical protein
MQKSKLPIGIQTFAEIRTEGYYYVDKTEAIAQLIGLGKYYFLSRPRRFGKSLLLDTIKEVFEGNAPLFEGLFIRPHWDWSKKYPVARISFGSGTLRNRAELDVRIKEQLDEIRAYLQLPANTSLDIAGNFRSLILSAQKQHQMPVVVLVDEYDKPILDNILKADIAEEMREGLKNLYTVIKDADAHIKFCLITGVSKFSKVSLFSGLNNLNDITLEERYSSICGYTDKDLDEVFAPDLPGLDRDEIRKWYNGYNWSGESVYNPFDILLLLDKRQFKSYWFETATPEFLIKILQEREFFTPDFSKLISDHELLGQFDVGNISTEALLFQTGYLTIKVVHQPILGVYEIILSYPNLEVEISLNKALLPALGLDASRVLKSRQPLLVYLTNSDFTGLQNHLKSLYASIPFDWYRKNPIANYEGHYASIFYSHFVGLGLSVTVEDSCSTGRVDMVVDFNHCIYVFEFKVVEDTPTGAALAQIKAKNYAQKYVKDNKFVYLIGVEFSKMQKQIVAFEVERCL